MNLSSKSIIKQFTHELIEWKTLNLHPDYVVGTVDRNHAYANFEKWVKSENSPTALTAPLHELKLYATKHSSTAFFEHFLAAYPDEDPSVPRPPHFCALSLFRHTIRNNTIQTLTDSMQSVLIQANLDLIFPTVAEKMNGVMIAAKTGNEEMVAFLLRPEFTQCRPGEDTVTFPLETEAVNLLAKATTTAVRKVIYEAVATRIPHLITADIMSGLISHMKTADDWHSLYCALDKNNRELLLNRTSGKVWLNLITNAKQLVIIDEVLPEQALSDVLDKLWSMESKIINGDVILRLLGRMNLKDRLAYVIKLGSRVDKLFDNKSFEQCVNLLGYTVEPENPPIVKLHNLYGPVELHSLLPLVNKLNYTIWVSPLSNAEKLQYFQVIQQILTADSPKIRQAAIEAYKKCVNTQEKRLTTLQDANRSFFMRWIRYFLRFLGIIPPLTITVEARALLKQVIDVIKISPEFHAVLFDLKDIILPKKTKKIKEQQKKALSVLAEAELDPQKYTEFWGIMACNLECQALCDQLLSSDTQFNQLLQALESEAKIKGLVNGFTPAIRNTLMGVQHNTQLLNLMKQPLLPMRVLLNSLGEQKHLLLQDPKVMGVILAGLVKTPSVFKAFLDHYIPNTLALSDSFDHLKIALMASPEEHFQQLIQCFQWPIPLTISPTMLGELINQLAIEKLGAFWSTFLAGRHFSVDEIGQLLENVDETKRKLILQQWMTPDSITEWTPSVTNLLPAMTEAQQTQAIAIISKEQWLIILENNQLASITSQITGKNAKHCLAQLSGVITDKKQLTMLLGQLKGSDWMHLTEEHALMDCLKLMNSKDLLGLIHQLTMLTDEQWCVIAPKILLIATQVLNFPPSDPLIQLLSQHVRPEEHVALLTRFREASEQGQHRLIEYFHSPVIQALLKHHNFPFSEINQTLVKQLCECRTLVFFAESGFKPTLVSRAEELFTGLIKRQEGKLKQQTHALGLYTENKPENPIVKCVYTAPVGFGWGAPSYDVKTAKAVEDLRHTISALCDGLNLLSTDLCAFYRLHFSLTGLIALMPVYHTIKSVGTRLHDVKSRLFEYAKSKSTPALTLPLTESQEVRASDYYKEFGEALENQANKIEETQAALLKDLNEETVLNILRREGELQELIKGVTPANRTLFLQRCRNFFSKATDKKVWIHQLRLFSPSLHLLFDNVPELFAIFKDLTFEKVVREFQSLSLELWKILAPKLLEVRTALAQPDDRWLRIINNISSPTAQEHILNLIRIADDNQLQRLFAYLSSDVVKQLVRLGRINYETLTLAEVTSPQCDVQHKTLLVEEIETHKAKVSARLDDLEALSIGTEKKTGLCKLLTPAPSGGLFTGGLFSWSTSFEINKPEIMEKLTDIKNALTDIRTQSQELQLLHALSGGLTETTKLFEKINAIISKIKKERDAYNQALPKGLQEKIDGFSHINEKFITRDAMFTWMREEFEKLEQSYKNVAPAPSVPQLAMAF